LFFLATASLEELAFQRSVQLFTPPHPLTSLAATSHLVLNFPSEDVFSKALIFFAQQEQVPVLIAVSYRGIFLNLLGRVSPYAYLAAQLKNQPLNLLQFCEKLLGYTFSFTSFFFYFSYFSSLLIVLLNQTLALLMLVQKIFLFKQ
jgi:hypothetical protein